LLVLNACSSPEDGTPSSPLSPINSSLASPLQPPSPTGEFPEEGLEDPAVVSALAADDLATWLGVDRAAVSILSTDQTAMTEGGPGCGPLGSGEQRGKTQGTEIVLRAKEREYVYQSDGERLLRCSDGADVMAVKRLFEMASSDLAAMLGVKAVEIELVQAEPQQWRNTSLGCPLPGMMYAQVITPGYRLTLAAGGKHYTYHTDSGQRFVRCEAE
jgi:hypothetical protein